MGHLGHTGRRRHVIAAGLLAILTGCGGGIEKGTTAEPTGTTAAPPAQGVYDGPSAQTAETLAADMGTPSALVVQGDEIVVTTSATMLEGELVAAGALFLVEKAASPALMIALDHQGASFDALAVDGDNAFVATSDGRLLAVPLAGGETTTLATLDSAATSITATNGYVYYATKSGALGRVAENGGAPVTLVTITNAIRGLTADDAAVYVATGAGEEMAAGIQRVALDGTVTSLASGDVPCAMIRDDRTLFWTASGLVNRVSLDGGGAATVAAGSFQACALAADSSSLWFADASGLLRRRSRAGRRRRSARAPTCSRSRAWSLSMPPRTDTSTGSRIRPCCGSRSEPQVKRGVRDAVR